MGLSIVTVRNAVSAVSVTLAVCAYSAQVGYDTLIAHRGESHDAPEDSEVKVVNDPRLSDHALLRCRLTFAPRLLPPR